MVEMPSEDPGSGIDEAGTDATSAAACAGFGAGAGAAAAVDEGVVVGTGPGVLVTGVADCCGTARDISCDFTGAGAGAFEAAGWGLACVVLRHMNSSPRSSSGESCAGLAGVPEFRNYSTEVKGSKPEEVRLMFANEAQAERQKDTPKAERKA
jgi:hypothetical protein